MTTMEDRALEIGGHPIGNGHPAFLIAEVGQAHDGSPDRAHGYIDAIAKTGANAVKFQTHVADAESTLDEPFRVPLDTPDETRMDYWRRTEFSPSAWAELASHATEKELVFLSSAFSVEAVDLLQSVGVSAWKVGSGELGSVDVLDAMAATGKPILLSTGMSTYDEIEAAFQRCKSGESDVAILQCTSRYPLTLEEVGLNVLDELRARFDCPVGLSDHSGSRWPGIAALARGASIIETHVVHSRGTPGPDTPASLTIEELADLARARDAIATMLNNPVDKNFMAAELAPMREMFTKSVALRKDLPAGTVLTAAALTAKKPGTGIAPARMDEFIGRKLSRDVSAERLLREEDFDG